MKSTKIKISVSQDGLLPQESIEVSRIQFPALPKRLLRALGFERVDNTTFVGVMPVFVNTGDKDQEIEVELGVSLPEMREKILELFQRTLSDTKDEPKTEPEPKKTKKTAKATKKTTKKTTKTAAKKPAAAAKKPAKAAKTKASPKKKTTTKSTTKKKTTSKKNQGVVKNVG